MPRFTVVFVQPGESFGGQYYLPFATGLLQAYAMRHLPSFGDLAFPPAVYRKEPLAEVVPRLRSADLVLFSSYAWNHQYNLEVARRLREARPDAVIVFGGPQVPETAGLLEAFLREHPYIDLGIHGEGEVACCQLLAHFPDRSWEQVPNLGRIRPGGDFLGTAPAPRIRDLDLIPSPYLEGIFDPLMAQHPEERWQALLETNRGCPFRCSYCTWGSKERNRVHRYDLGRVFAEIDWISQHRIEFVFCCDANFGLFPERDRDIVDKVAGNKLRTGFPAAFSVQSTKNATRTIFELNRVLHEAGLQKGVNLALQSVHPPTLRSIRRANISAGSYRDLQNMFSEAGIATFSDLILGLPLETYESFADGVDRVVAGGQHNRIQFLNLSVLENSELADPAFQQRHGIVVRECRMVSHHTALEPPDEVPETQRLVVGTASMPPEDWVRARAFCWTFSLLHFNKLFQIPFVVANRLAGQRYRSLVELFLEAGPRYPVLREIRALLAEKARAIQGGDCEYVPAPEWLNIWWPPDEHVFISLCLGGRLRDFYREGEALLAAHLAREARPLPPGVLEEAVRLNAALVKQPGSRESRSLAFSNDLWGFYRAALRGEDVPLATGRFTYEVNPGGAGWETAADWLRDVVWYGTKKGAYLHDCVLRV